MMTIYHYFFLLRAKATTPIMITATIIPTAIYNVLLLDDGVVGVFTFENVRLTVWLCPLTEADPVRLLYPLDEAA